MTPEALEAIREMLGRAEDWGGDIEMEQCSPLFHAATDLLEAFDELRSSVRGLNEFLIAHRARSQQLRDNAELTFDRAIADTRLHAFNSALGHGAAVRLWPWTPLEESANEQGGPG